MTVSHLPAPAALLLGVAGALAALLALAARHGRRAAAALEDEQALHFGGTLTLTDAGLWRPYPFCGHELGAHRSQFAAADLLRAHQALCPGFGLWPLEPPQRRPPLNLIGDLP